MSNWTSLLTALILVIILLGFVFQLAVNSNSAKENNMVNETESSVSLTVTKRNILSSDMGELDTSSESACEQTYDSFLDFPYNDMRFIDRDAFETIKDAYDKIEFYSEFKQGNLEIYDFYKEKYNQLLKNEVTFIHKETGVEFYLNEFSSLDGYDLKDGLFCFFDMDEDGAPELCIKRTYIFKYIPASDKIILWYEGGISWYSLFGSKTIIWNREGIMHAFYKLDEGGEEVYSAFFFSREDFNRRTNQIEVVCMVTFPKYTNKDEQIKITEDIKKQAYFDKGNEIYYFRVMEEQFDELTKDYFEAESLAKENLKKVTFTYDELFGNSLSEF